MDRLVVEFSLIVALYSFGPISTWNRLVADSLAYGDPDFTLSARTTRVGFGILDHHLCVQAIIYSLAALNDQWRQSYLNKLAFQAQCTSARWTPGSCVSPRPPLFHPRLCLIFGY